MLEPDGSANTAHSLNPVPFVVTVAGLELAAGGILADVAPTALALLGIEQPDAMTGRSLLACQHTRLSRCESTRRDCASRSRRATAARAPAPCIPAHGPVPTPAFIPLATRGAVRTLDFGDVAALGYELVLGNTFHLFLTPGADRIAALGGLHRFIGWKRAIITDSGGFQVFSLAHGNVADEIKGRRGGAGGSGGVLEISERGVRFRSYVDGSERFMGPEESMSVQAALASDIALVFDECTPFHADYDYTARSTERTHRWLGRCLDWHAQSGPAGQAVFGIVQGGVHEDLRRLSADAVSAAEVDGIAIGGTLGRDKPEMHGVLAMTAPMLPAEAPKHLLGIGEPDDLLEGIGLGIDLFDCAVPTRLARHGIALANLPETRFRFDLTRPVHASGRVTAGRRLSLLGLRAPHACLPALPLPGRERERRTAADAAQPDLPRTPGSRSAGGDRRIALRCLSRRGDGRDGPVGRGGRVVAALAMPTTPAANRRDRAVQRRARRGRAPARRPARDRPRAGRRAHRRRQLAAAGDRGAARGHDRARR